MGDGKRECLTCTKKRGKGGVYWSVKLNTQPWSLIDRINGDVDVEMLFRLHRHRTQIKRAWVVSGEIRSRDTEINGRNSHYGEQH